MQVRTFGSGPTVVVVLHGMAASGHCFGAAFDRLGRSARVVVPDLPGFDGRSGPGHRADHLAALDAMRKPLVAWPTRRWSWSGTRWIAAWHFGVRGAPPGRD